MQQQGRLPEQAHLLASPAVGCCLHPLACGPSAVTSASTGTSLTPSLLPVLEGPS